MKFSVFAALAALAVAQPASAAIYQVTATGTMKDGFDQTGFFGAPNRDLTGLAYSVVQTFDTELGHLNLTGNTIYGGTQTGYPSAFANGVLTIDGVSVAIAGPSFSYISSPTQGTSDGFISDQSIVDGIETYYLLAVKLNFHAPVPSLATLPSWHSDCVGVEYCDGGFDFYSAKLNNPGPDTYYWETIGNFTGDSIDVRVLPGGVPEPATWAMMIMGFGLVGSALRRRMAMAQGEAA